MSEGANHSTRVAIISACVSFFLSVVVAAFIIGQRTGKVLELEKWKNEIAPIISRMDSVGSLAFDHWKQAHDKESDRWKEAHRREHDQLEARIKTLESEMKDLNKKIDP